MNYKFSQRAISSAYEARLSYTILLFGISGSISASLMTEDIDDETIESLAAVSEAGKAIEDNAIAAKTIDQEAPGTDDVSIGNRAEEIPTEDCFAVEGVPGKAPARSAMHILTRLPMELQSSIFDFTGRVSHTSMYKAAIEYLPRINHEGLEDPEVVVGHTSIQYIRIVKALKDLVGFETLDETLEYLWTREDILNAIGRSIVSSSPLRLIQMGLIDSFQAAILLRILREYLKDSSRRAIDSRKALVERGACFFENNVTLYLTDDISLRPGMTDEDLVYLTDLLNLQILVIFSTQLTDAGLFYLIDLPNLQNLTLPPLITDAGLVHIGKIASLRVLDLRGTQVTAEGLGHLANLTNLERLYLPSRRTEEARDYLRSGLRHSSDRHIRIF